MRCLLPEAIMSVARSRLIQRFGRDWMIYALFHCGVEYLISQNSGFWDSLYITPYVGGTSPEAGYLTARHTLRKMFRFFQERPTVP